MTALVLLFFVNGMVGEGDGLMAEKGEKKFKLWWSFANTLAYRLFACKKYKYSAKFVIPKK
ncbi:hypothetical protein V2J09_001583 [Rumex salicifolius]